MRKDLPEKLADYDTIVVNSRYKPLPSHTVKEIVTSAKNGKDLIVIGNECLYNSSAMHGLYSVLPVDIKSVDKEGSHTIETVGSGKIFLMTFRSARFIFENSLLLSRKRMLQSW